MCEMNFCGGRLSRLDNLIPPQGPASHVGQWHGGPNQEGMAVSARRPVLPMAAGGGAAIDY